MLLATSTCRCSLTILSVLLLITPRFTYYRTKPRRANVLSQNDDDVPHVTAIRPCKGYEPFLYECLVAALQQDYPTSKLTVSFCVPSKHDDAWPTIEKVLRDYPQHDARAYVEEEDTRLLGTNSNIGPNPKIRNMSRAYSEAKGDLIWIVDCNVWLNPGACGRMVDKLCGFGPDDTPSRPYKLVHHLPLAVDVSETQSRKMLSRYDAAYDGTDTSPLSSAQATSTPGCFGGRLDELFLSSAHAKMYVAINVVAVAPCIVGKSSMFRRSHLDSLTDGCGIDYFSYNICEDHLIGDLLWRSKLPRDHRGLKHKNHGLVMGDFAIQPVAGMSVANYIARRVRWLRVRKFTVPAATLVEPGTESILCSFYGGFGATTSRHTQHLFGSTWTVTMFWWVISIIVWASVDRLVYILLQSGLTVEEPSKAPPFAKPPREVSTWSARRSVTPWAKAWAGREFLALPVWLWAIWGGVTVTWRDKKLWVGMDMKVHEIEDRQRLQNGNGPWSASEAGKKRI